MREVLLFGNHVHRFNHSVMLNMEAMKKKFVGLNHVHPKIDTLYAKGDADLLFKQDFFVAIVGTRRCTSYGLKLADMFAGHISRSGHCVVSGLAAGIDAAAHKGALARGGRTVGVVAGGIDSVFPLSNRKLYEKMEKNACILAEHEGVTDNKKFRFPMRNRIVAAISDIVIVVEAPAKSGALITAELALELGKTVVAVPGSVFSFRSVGSNKLIEDGAIPLCSTGQLDDLIAMLRSSDTFGANKSGRIMENIRKRKEGKAFRAESLSSYSSAAILKFRVKKRMNLFELSADLEISITDVMDILDELTREGVIRHIEGDVFEWIHPNDPNNAEISEQSEYPEQSGYPERPERPEQPE